MKRFIAALMAVTAAVLMNVPAGAESVLLNGQKQYYTVQLRSDKQAIVYARIIVENPSADKSLTNYEFTLPKGVTIHNESAQQILAKTSGSQTCKTYETLEQWRSRQQTGTFAPSDNSYPNSRRCIDWQTATLYDESYDFDQNSASSTDYYYYSYYQKRDTKFDYLDLTHRNDGNNYTVTLSEPIKPKKQGSLLISFTTNDFVTGGLFGRYDYNVRTLLAKQMIDKTTVSVNFDDDMFTREAEQKRTYQTNSTSDKIMAGAESASGAPYQSKSMDSIISNAGRGGIYVKTQASLLPGDTLSVTGVFGTNAFVLYGREFLIALLCLAVLGELIWLFANWRKAHPRKRTANALNDNAETSTLATTLVVEDQPTSWGRIIITCVASIVATTVASLAVANIMTGAHYGSGTANVLAILGLIVVVFFGTVLLPALYMFPYGIKNVFKWALVQFAVLVVLLIILSLLITGSGPEYYN